MKQTPVTCEALRAYTDSYSSSSAKKTLTNVFSRTSLADLSFDPVASRDVNFRFSNNIKTMSATNQKSSGRCWLFAATNLLREIIAKKKNLDSFELSQSHLAFWDKFERANYFIDSIIDTASLPDGDRTVDYILATGVGDGGQWDMFVNIVRKYGIIPKDAMPETFQSSATSQVNKYLNLCLRKAACLIRSVGAEDPDREAKIEEIRQKTLDSVFSFLCECYTLPPEKFDFEYTDKDGGYHLEKDFTPISFRDEMIGDYLDDYVSIINAPTADKPFGKTYTVAYLGNISGAPDIVYLNLEIGEFKETVKKQLLDGEPVWFGSDCGKFSDSTRKVWDPGAFDYELLTGLDLSMTKQQMLDYGVSKMNHAMVFTGVNIDGDGKPNRWKVENSWGSDGPNKGYHTATDDWFDAFVYQAVVNKKYLGAYADVLTQKPTVLLPWDPMGSLAD
ncbi:MAG: C1 family peptidase [Clostridia bacterium]|nr:C1 family peptidase [Clostridia bacterium]